MLFSRRAVAFLVLVVCSPFRGVADEPVTRIGPLLGQPSGTGTVIRPDIAQLIFSAPQLTPHERHDLGPLDAVERARLNAPRTAGDRALRVGVVRPLMATVGLDGLADDARPAQETRVHGGLLERLGDRLYWTAAFRSHGATGIRLELEGSLPQDAQVYIYASTGEAHGPYTSENFQGGSFWTNTVYADEAFLEVQLRAGEAGDAHLKVRSIVHIESAALQDGHGGVTPSGYECFIDVTCVNAGSEFPNLQQASKSLAQLSYIKDNSAYVCSGGLINTTRQDGTPYLLTANHCFTSQASATSLEATWKYMTTGCTDPNVNPSRSLFPRSLGATLLATSTASDFTFVRLAQPPPSDAVFLGWDGSTDYSTRPGTKLYRAHHPQGLTQFYARASVTTSGCTTGASPRGNFIYAKDEVGGTSGGSSGSPVYLSDLTVVGQLRGACGPEVSNDCNRSNNAIEGAFRATFPSIVQWLAPGNNSGGFTCTPSATVACMLNNRFKVEVRYRAGFDNNAADTSASVKAVTGFSTTDFETGFFYFNSAANIEFLIKILDQGNTNGSGQRTIAILTGLSTPLRVEVTVTDSTNGVQKKYNAGFATQAGVTDFTAFVK